MTELIVEVASNHGGERVWQERFIDNAAACQAEWVKFQSYQTAHLRHDDPQYDWLQHAELSDADHERLLKRCQQVGVNFLTTAYTADRVPFLASLGLKAIKVGSGEAMNVPLLRAIAEHPWKVYVSTGLVTRQELERCNAILAHREVVLLHCVSAYPTPNVQANLGRMHWLTEKTLRPVGYSDHTIGNDAARLAMAHGAACVEVHHSSETAPRCQPWDKLRIDLSVLHDYRVTVDTLQTTGRMVYGISEQRPYVGRWQHGV